MRSSHLKTVLFCGAILLGHTGFAEESPSAHQDYDFNRRIRPILSNHCFQCHGQDGESREADLRLDVRGEAVEYGAIVPGRPSESSLIDRVTALDAESRMPPSGHEPLSAEDIEALRGWIATGAKYETHWAFQPPNKLTSPETRVGDSNKRLHPIDFFVGRELQKRGLQPSVEADRVTLIRRLYQDLLGLIPARQAVDAFVDNTSPNAYEQLVEELLESRHYGERWGRHWLDQARYADSHGYTIDGSRTMWPYRDWVIRAFNEDMPFNQFTIEQLAGDLLPKPSKSQLIATAFHRNTMINQEGGVKADQFRHEAIVDRVNTTGAVWLGLTLGCVQCHAHKYDPISHQEYYQIYAFFNGCGDANNTGRTVEVSQDELLDWTPRKARLAAELLQMKTELQELEQEEKAQEGDSEFEEPEWRWESAAIKSYETESGATLHWLPDQSLMAGEEVAKRETYRVVFDRPKAALTAIRIRALKDERLPRNGPGRASNGNFVLTDLQLVSAGRANRFATAWADHSQNGYSVAHAIDDRDDTGWAINTDQRQRDDGVGMNRDHEAIFTLATPILPSDQPITLVLRHDLNDDYQIGRFAVDVSSTAVVGNQTAELKERIAGVRARISEIEEQLPGRGRTGAQMVMSELETPPNTYRLVRGDFLVPAKDEGKLSPGVPAALGSTTIHFQNRLDLAHWLVSRGNPLTARVTVNRVWAKYFGRGLVETENDFGFQGSPPSHPELLDWLAVDFMDHGWSLKHLHRTVVTSKTYRQTSHVTKELFDTDPGNVWLARQSRFRVEAEIVRDQMLSAGGLLTAKIGGPSVFPPQPQGVFDFTQNKKSWPVEKGANRYRRTMYTMFYRSAPYPLLTTFDAPDFSNTCTRRIRTNTPLQALTLANDPMFIELARGLVTTVLRQLPQADHEAVLDEMFRRCLSRSPQPIEAELLQNHFVTEYRRFSASPDDCKLFAGENSPEVAALTSVVRVLMNTDEFVTRN